MFAIIDSKTGEKAATVKTLPAMFALPDGGVAQFNGAGDERPAHAPTHRLVEAAEVTIPPDYPHVVTTASEEYANGRWEISRGYAPDVSAYQRAIESHVDEVARSRGYSSAVSVATYAASTIEAWAAEAAAFIAWRDAVWAHAFTQLAAVQAGEKAPPALEDFMAGMPVIEWPS